MRGSGLNIALDVTEKRAPCRLATQVGTNVTASTENMLLPQVEPSVWQAEPRAAMEVSRVDGRLKSAVTQTGVAGADGG